MVFAAGGLGIGAAANAILCMGILILIVAVFFALFGIKFAVSARKSTRWLGFVTMLLSCSLPFLFCFSFRELPGRSELRLKIREGITEEEVIAAVGEPNSRQTGFWIYHCDLWGLNSFSVHFRDDGRVEGTYVSD